MIGWLRRRCRSTRKPANCTGGIVLPPMAITAADNASHPDQTPEASGRSASITLAVDAMGGDIGLDATVPASFRLIDRYSNLEMVLVGPLAPLEREIAKYASSQRARVRIYPASEVIDMHESAAQALRGKRDSSMRRAIELVRDGEAAACVSSGNTAALLAISRFVLRTIADIERPALCAPLPNLHGTTYMLDLGANTRCSPQLLLKFGLMGTALIECLEGCKRPSVGLLNIGQEDLKGDDTIREAADLFKQSDLNYTGFVEADKIFTGPTRLVVGDGFAGNVALKSSEGTAQLINREIHEAFGRNWASRACGLMALPVLNRLKRRLDHRRYNGASLLGLRGSVVKSHGSADALGFEHALEVAYEEAASNLLGRIRGALEAQLAG